MINRPTNCPSLLRVLLPQARSPRRPSIIRIGLLYLFQGDYIRHPVLYELSSKYGVAGSDQVPLPARLDVLREHIRREIRKVCRVSRIPSSTRSFCEAPFFFVYVHTVAWSFSLSPFPSSSSSALRCSLSLLSNNQL